MTDENTQNTSDAALAAANYTPPAQVTSNADSAQIAALIQAAVQQALAQQVADQAAAAAPKVLSPEEQARQHLDNRGVGLGVEERLQQVYALLHLIAQKVGI